jgi:purine catabolism regulator
MPDERDMTERTWTVRRVLTLPAFEGARVLAGEAGLDRGVDRVERSDDPAARPPAGPGTFLLTTPSRLPHRPDPARRFIVGLIDAGVTALGVAPDGEDSGRPSDHLLEPAGEYDVPVILLPEGVSPDHLVNAFLSATLDQQIRQSQRRELVHGLFLGIVLDGQGLAEIASRLAEVTRGPVAIVEASGEILAGARTEGMSSNEEPLTRIGLTDADDTVLVDGRPVTCLQAPIYAGRRLHGHVVALEPSDAVSDERLVIASAATAAALVLERQTEVVAQVQRYQSDFMYQLLRGSITEAADVRRRSEPFGWDLERRVIVLALERDDPQQDAPHGELPPIPLAIRSPILTRDPHAAVVKLRDDVVVVTEAFAWENGRANALRYAQSLQRTATLAYGTSVSVGMSRPVTQVLDIPHAYDQAITALRVGRRLHGRGVASHFNELGANRVLSLVEDQEELNSFAREVLGELVENGERVSDLRRTLEVLLETNVNVAESARRLHYHYNTLRLRMEKLEQMVGPFRDDAQVRLNVHLALLIRRMESPSS